MKYLVKETIRITGGKELIISPVTNNKNVIEKIRIPYTNDINKIKEIINKFFNEDIKNIILL